jgi:hypothetical protein
VKIHVGFDLTYESAHPMPMIFDFLVKQIDDDAFLRKTPVLMS